MLGRLGTMIGDRQYQLLDNLFGDDPDYFERNPGRPGFYPKQLINKGIVKLKKKYQYSRLSYIANYWLDTIPELNISAAHKHRMESCTWQLAKASPWLCSLSICPWCRTKKLMKVHALLAKYKHVINGCVDRVFHHDGYINVSKKTVFRSPPHKTVILAVRGFAIRFEVGRTIYSPVAIFFTAEHGYSESYELHGSWMISDCIPFRPDVIQNDAVGWMNEYKQVKNITVGYRYVT